jgi:magnesium transporter
MNSENNERQITEELEPVTGIHRPLLSQVFPKLGKGRLKDWSESSLDQERLQIEFVEYEGLRWYNIVQLRNAELAWLNQNFKVNSLHLEDITSHIQRPKMDDFEDYLFLVMHFPLPKKIEGNIRVCEVDILIGPDYVVTIHDGRLTHLKKYFEQCQKDPQRCQTLLGRTPGFLLYSILDLLIDHCFPLIDNLDDRIELVDEEIFKSASSSTIYYISALRREIITFRRIFKPQLPIIVRLARRFNQPEEIEGYFSDLTDHLGKIWDSLEDFKEIIEGLSATYDSLTSHRLNQIIKALTIISVVMLPLTLISSIYGMNVPLPWQEHPLAFGFLIIAMAITALGMLLFFRSRKWL